VRFKKSWGAENRKYKDDIALRFSAPLQQGICTGASDCQPLRELFT